MCCLLFVAWALLICVRFCFRCWLLVVACCYLVGDRCLLLCVMLVVGYVLFVSCLWFVVRFPFLCLFGVCCDVSWSALDVRGLLL